MNDADVMITITVSLTRDGTIEMVKDVRDGVVADKLLVSGMLSAVSIMIAAQFKAAKP